MEEGRNTRLIVGVSGGKDSTATCLHLIHNLNYKIEDFDRVFLDTGWENKQTYDYLDYIEKKIGPIIRLKQKVEIKKHKNHVDYFEKKLGYESPFIRYIFRYENFPRPFMKWCTQKLKMQPLKAFLDSLDFDVTNVVGIRKEESHKRSTMTEHDWSDYLNCDVWRPIINWTERDVINIHNEHEIIPNNLYLTGSNRVGCYPCIHSQKTQIRNLDQERIDLIHEIEEIINDIRRSENKKPCGFFRSKDFNKTTIKDIYEWSKTSRGGKQYMLFETTEPACMKWGLCEIVKK